MNDAGRVSQIAGLLPATHCRRLNRRSCGRTWCSCLVRVWTVPRLVIDTRWKVASLSTNHVSKIARTWSDLFAIKGRYSMSHKDINKAFDQLGQNWPIFEVLSPSETAYHKDFNLFLTVLLHYLPKFAKKVKITTNSCHTVNLVYVNELANTKIKYIVRTYNGNNLLKFLCDICSTECKNATISKYGLTTNFAKFMQQTIRRCQHKIIMDVQASFEIP